MYPIIKISKFLTRKYSYYFYFGLILLKDIYGGLLLIVFFNLVRQFNIFLKGQVRQARPYNMFPELITYYKRQKHTLSFPSQSIQSCLVISTLMTHYYPYYFVSLYFNSCLSMLALTRIYRGLHYPHDIIISYLFASYLLKYYIWCFVSNNTYIPNDF